MTGMNERLESIAKPFQVKDVAGMLIAFTRIDQLLTATVSINKLADEALI